MPWEMSVSPMTGSALQALPARTAEQIQAFNELQRLTSTPENAAPIIQGFNRCFIGHDSVATKSES